MKANEILTIGNEILKTERNGKRSIYKDELFSECKTDKEKRALRIRLRRKTHQFLGDFLAKEKNEKELQSLREAWKKFSKEVYISTSKIFEKNASEENKNLAARFLAAMSEKPLKPAKNGK